MVAQLRRVNHIRPTYLTFRRMPRMPIRYFGKLKIIVQQLLQAYPCGRNLLHQVYLGKPWAPLQRLQSSISGLMLGPCINISPFSIAQSAQNFSLGFQKGRRSLLTRIEQWICRRLVQGMPPYCGNFELHKQVLTVGLNRELFHALSNCDELRILSFSNFSCGVDMQKNYIGGQTKDSLSLEVVA